jgi:rare lipoprotein A (peptidoglycan hydrolase)
VRGSFAERAAWLAAIALVAFVVALAITRRGEDENESLPAAVVVPGTKTGYYTAKAAPYGPTERRSRTACGRPLLETTEGVAHPVLPCGVRLYIRFHGREVLTQVVDQGPNVPGREFDITKALANRLDLHGTQTISWRFAR